MSNLYDNSDLVQQAQEAGHITAEEARAICLTIFQDNLTDERRNELTRTEIKKAMEQTHSAIPRANEAPERKWRFQVKRANDLLSKQIDLPPCIIKGLMHQGHKMCIIGDSKFGKTWASIHLAVSLSQGLPWLGFETCQTKVLYINPEHLEPFFELRLKSAGKIKNVVGLSNLEYVTTRGMRFEGNELYEEIEHAIEGRQFGVIILDSIYKLYDPDMDENSNSDVARFLHKIEVLAAKTNCSIVYSHHHSKGNQAGKNVKDRASGAGVFLRDIDTAVHFTEHQDDKSYTVEFTVRDFRTPEPFVVEVDWPDITKNTTANPADLKTTAQKAVSHVKDILDILAVTPTTTTNLLRQLKTQTNISNSKFYEEWPKVKAVKGVVKDAEDSWFYGGASSAEKTCST